MPMFVPRYLHCGDRAMLRSATFAHFPFRSFYPSAITKYVNPDGQVLVFTIFARCGISLDARLLLGVSITGTQGWSERLSPGQ